MTRWARVPESVLELLPVRLVGRYAWLAVHADYGTGRVRAQSWPELAALMRCGERNARYAIEEMLRLGVVSGKPPRTIEIATNGATACKKPASNGATSCNTPSLQKDQSSALRVVSLWNDFVEGRRGERKNYDRAPRHFVDAVRASGISPEQLSDVCRLAGESYAEWDGRVNFRNALETGLEALSRGDTVAKSAREMLEEW